MVLNPSSVAITPMMSPFWGQFRSVYPPLGQTRFQTQAIWSLMPNYNLLDNFSVQAVLMSVLNQKIIRYLLIFKELGAVLFLKMLASTKLHVFCELERGWNSAYNL